MVHHHYYIITGGPGVGKTTLLQALESRRYHCIPEAARRIIQTQAASGGDALPWKNNMRYAELMLQESIAAYLQAGAAATTFFDRGIPDVMAHVRLSGLPVTDELSTAITSFRYNPTVFILPPWKDIYETDNERKQTWEEALATFEALKEAYTASGYRLTEIPPMPVAERADFVAALTGRTSVE